MWKRIVCISGGFQAIQDSALHLIFNAIYLHIYKYISIIYLDLYFYFQWSLCSFPDLLKEFFPPSLLFSVHINIFYKLNAFDQSGIHWDLQNLPSAVYPGASQHFHPHPYLKHPRAP